jgi:hypothetical protein
MNIINATVIPWDEGGASPPHRPYVGALLQSPAPVTLKVLRLFLLLRAPSQDQDAVQKQNTDVPLD